jgi:hypothetical protein
MNKNLRKLGLLAMTMFASNVIFAQAAVCDSTSRAKPGTYEIINIAGSTESSNLPKLNLNSEILCLIESKRENDKIVNYQYNSNILIRIYPKVIKSIEAVNSK